MVTFVNGPPPVCHHDNDGEYGGDDLEGGGVVGVGSGGSNGSDVPCNVDGRDSTKNTSSMSGGGDDVRSIGESSRGDDDDDRSHATKQGRKWCRDGSET